MNVGDNVNTELPRWVYDAANKNEAVCRVGYAMPQIKTKRCF